jgi:hypothetical protein
MFTEHSDVEKYVLLNAMIELIQYYALVTVLLRPRLCSQLDILKRNRGMVTHPPKYASRNLEQAGWSVEFLTVVGSAVAFFGEVE